MPTSPAKPATRQTQKGEQARQSQALTVGHFGTTRILTKVCLVLKRDLYKKRGLNSTPGLPLTHVCTTGPCCLKPGLHCQVFCDHSGNLTSTHCLLDVLRIYNQYLRKRSKH